MLGSRSRLLVRARVAMGIVSIICLVSTAPVYANDEQDTGRNDRAIREAFQRGDYARARELLLESYELEARPEYLFALGQVELNLGNYEAAIDYYERFIATSPSDEDVALAQQAIGAARMRIATPPPKDTTVAPVQSERPRVPARRWKTEDTGFVALGGAAVLVGGGLLYYSHRLGNDRSGTLSDFDARIELARTTRWTGVGVAAAGALVIGVTVLRWRLRPDGADLSASVAPGAATLAWSTRW